MLLNEPPDTRTLLETVLQDIAAFQAASTNPATWESDAEGVAGQQLVSINSTQTSGDDVPSGSPGRSCSYQDNAATSRLTGGGTCAAHASERGTHDAASLPEAVKTGTVPVVNEWSTACPFKRFTSREVVGPGLLGKETSVKKPVEEPVKTTGAGSVATRGRSACIGLEENSTLQREVVRLLRWVGKVHQERSDLMRAHNKNAVTLTTMHGSKGREWDHVFIISLNEGACNSHVNIL